MSRNQSFTLHGSLAAPHHGGGHHGGGHHGGGGRFRRSFDSDYIPFWAYPDAITHSVDDEVAFHESMHDIVTIQAPGHSQQIRQAVVDALKARGWVESTKDGARLLSPPALVATLKGLGMIHGLGVVTPPDLLNPAEIMGLGVGGVMIVAGIVVEGMIGTALAVLGGGAMLFAGGSAMLRNVSVAAQAATQAAQAAAPGSAAAVQQQQTYAAAFAPPPPPPPVKPTSSQRLTAAATAYGPAAIKLIEGIVSIL
jgi:hypothetical protein